MTTVPTNWPDIRRAGLQALRDRLGIAGTMHFLQMMEGRSGDYTKERHDWLAGRTLDDVVHDIRESKPESVEAPK